MRQINFFRPFLILLALATATAHAQQPQTNIEKRTGHTLPPAQGKTRFALPDGVKLDDGLSEDEAVAIALWNNAALHVDLAALGLARADLVDAGLLRNPILQVVLPIGPYKQFESALSFPLEVFWQRRRRVEAATIEVDRVAQGLEQNALNLIRDVRVAYADMLLAQERVALAREAVDLREQTVKLTDVRLRVGDVGEIESIAAHLDQSLAEEQATRLRREVILARDRLMHLLGMGEERIDFKLQTDSSQLVPASFSQGGSSGSSLSGIPGTTAKLDELLQAAYESRPDLRAAELSIEVAAKRARWERSRVATLAGLLNIKQGEGLGFSPRPGLIAELPIFNRNQGGISRADAEVQRATWQYLAVRQRITLEVQEAYNQLGQSREALLFWRNRIIPQAAESVRLSNKAFTSGDQSYLYVLDATRRFVEVRTREVELRADARRAAAQLDRSVGRKFDAKP